MARTEQYTADQMIEAITKANGMLTKAAEVLKCSYKTVTRYIDKYPTVKDAYHECRFKMADGIESTLLSEAMGRLKRDRDGNPIAGEYEREPNVSALIFLAKTHPAMRERGYAERTEVTTPDDKPLTIKVIRKATGD